MSEERREDPGRKEADNGPEENAPGEGKEKEGDSVSRKEKGKKASREDSQPRDHELYTPQGGGGGTGGGSIRDVPVTEGSPKTGPREDLREDVDRPGELTLPQVADRVVEAEGEEEGEAGAPPEAIPEKEEVSSFRLLMTLAVAGAIAGAVLVFVHLWSQPRILAYQAKVLDQAIQEVLKSPDRYQTLFLLSDSTLTATLPEGVDSLDENQVLDRVYLGYDESGNPIGYAVQGEGFGFQDIISLIFGYDAQEDRVLGMKVLSHLETPGLGDKIVKDTSFVNEFNGVAGPIDPVKPDRNTGEPDQVDMITGATISSEAVIDIINRRIVSLGELLDEYDPSAATAGASVRGTAGVPELVQEAAVPAESSGVEEEHP